MITMNRLMRGDEVIGYRFDIPELGKSYDMFEYEAKRFYNAVGKQYFQKEKPSRCSVMVLTATLTMKRM